MTEDVHLLLNFQSLKMATSKVILVLSMLVLSILEIEGRIFLIPRNFLKKDSKFQDRIHPRVFPEGKLLLQKNEYAISYNLLGSLEFDKIKSFFKGIFLKMNKFLHSFLHFRTRENASVSAY